MTDKNVVDSMADAMLGIETKKEEPRKPVGRTRIGNSWDDLDFLEGEDRGGSTKSRPNRTLPTTDKGASRNESERSGPTRPVYDHGVSKSQPMSSGVLRSKHPRLTMDDVNAIDTKPMREAMVATMLDALEQQGWILCGSAEAVMFKSAVMSGTDSMIRSVLMKTMTSDLMRSTHKTKIS